MIELKTLDVQDGYRTNKLFCSNFGNIQDCQYQYVEHQLYKAI